MFQIFFIVFPRLILKFCVRPWYQVSVASEGRVDERGTGSMVITLVLRGKNSDPDSLLGKLLEVWRGRAWESTSGGSGSGKFDGGSSSGGGGLRMPVVGVSGILRKEQEMWESTDKSLQDAFQDLNALMSKAKEMVMLAEKMRLKLLSGSNNQASVANDEDEMGSKEEMQDWLLSVGIASPVTKESAGALYHQQLSRQLADFVKIPLERSGGMINLIDIYCVFNRARGTELISPEDLLQACSLWKNADVPVMLRKFDSGVMVIQNKSYNDEKASLIKVQNSVVLMSHSDRGTSILSRNAYGEMLEHLTRRQCEVLSGIKSLALKPEALQTGISASDAAIMLGIAPAMAKEHLLTAESKGLLCRDVSPDGFRFYVNLFQDIDLDDVYLVKDHSAYGSWVSTACF
ncbi:hypothetical protein RHMOL_Rhmol01G0127200 [Rhododendron molle]|uniref:Uncharacterized protein n=1 Tax=Rhododendron molle TaxID=49168 RepID=A0ACC0Q0I0_RHOML|nr:hypothetical protein RHMOL_Rhmol01G0127200 [Rhododendron molle]